MSDDKKKPWDKLRGQLEDNGASSKDLDRVDEVTSRRKFLGQLGALGALATLGAASETGLVSRGLIPEALAEEADASVKEVSGKPGMLVHNVRPVNGEFAPHLLNDDITPTERHFVRNNGLVPDQATQRDAQGWKLTIDGEVHTPLELTLADLKAMDSVSLPMLIECGGNGRANFEPAVRGNPWDRGAVGCAQWTGVPLRDILKKAGLKDTAVYTAHYGDDPSLGAAPPFSRGVPIDKAMDKYTIVAYQMNGKDLDPLNGFPVRLVVPGWVGSCSQKWLNRIWVRDQVHDSKKMSGYAYRVPKYPVIPGTKPPKEDMEIATAWRIKSLITNLEPNSKFAVGQKIPVGGHAWAGENKVNKVYISTDYGITWEKAKLNRAPNKYSWQRFASEVSFKGKGYYEIWARAFDDDGNTQPFQQPWNPKGYLGNVIHRVPVLVGV